MIKLSLMFDISLIMIQVLLMIINNTYKNEIIENIININNTIISFFIIGSIYVILLSGFTMLFKGA